jgi:hypothetical protein
MKDAKAGKRSALQPGLFDAPFENLPLREAVDFYAANVLEKSDLVAAYAKNDHLGYQMYYLWSRARRRLAHPTVSG